MADKNWGFKIFCECGTKYYSMNKKEKILCPNCLQEYVPEDLNFKVSPTSIEPQIKKKLEDIENIDDTDDAESDDIISLDDQKDIEESDEDLKTD